MIPKLIHLRLELANKGTAVVAGLAVAGLIVIALAAIDADVANHFLDVLAPWARLQMGTPAPS